jgi:hypothetical protein
VYHSAYVRIERDTVRPASATALNDRSVTSPQFRRSTLMAAVISSALLAIAGSGGLEDVSRVMLRNNRDCKWTVITLKLDSRLDIAGETNTLYNDPVGYAKSAVKWQRAARLTTTACQPGGGFSKLSPSTVIGWFKDARQAHVDDEARWAKSAPQVLTWDRHWESNYGRLIGIFQQIQ